ncbi:MULTISPECIES: hypothetical protein [unclassified Exiguobacterium]|uniref:hypothetical protein n=1 Tax=unclassified Exiguobacterium TaxID=2644629 RepID=UPI0025BF0BA8|nr:MULTISPECIES: hypothetical protein [unclassified Exiguobacterium]
MKVLGKVLVIVLLAIAFLVPDTALAATKEETRLTELYKDLKHGMTIEQVATTLYGKEAEKHIRYRKGQPTILRVPINDETVEEGHKQLIQVMEDRSVKQGPSLVLHFMTKKRSNVYRLVIKGVFIERKSTTGYRESTRQLKQGAKPENGMTEKQIDAMLTGKGLGHWTTVANMNTTSGYSKEEVRRGFQELYRIKTYIFPTSQKNKWKEINFAYSHERKKFVVDNIRIVGPNDTAPEF